MESGNVDIHDARSFSTADVGPTSIDALDGNHVGVPIVAVKQDDDVYPMDLPNGRKALIFCHYKYDRTLHLDERRGTEVDMKALRDMLPKLGFHNPKVFYDLTVCEITTELRKVANADHVNTDCLAVFVLTHGDVGKLYAYDGEYHVNFLWDEFTGGKGKNLIGRPKLFFIQACQGDYIDRGQLAQYIARAPVYKQWGGGFPFLTPQQQHYEITTQSDIFIGLATVPFYPANRNSQTGSWFIQDLCKVFSERHNTLDLKSMFTIVCREVSKRKFNMPGSSYHKAMQTPMEGSTLLRDLYFKTP